MQAHGWAIQIGNYFTVFKNMRPTIAIRELDAGHAGNNERNTPRSGWRAGSSLARELGPSVFLRLLRVGDATADVVSDVKGRLLIAAHSALAGHKNIYRIPDVFRVDRQAYAVDCCKNLCKIELDGCSDRRC